MSSTQYERLETIETAGMRNVHDLRSQVVHLMPCCAPACTHHSARRWPLCADVRGRRRVAVCRTIAAIFAMASDEQEEEMSTRSITYK